MLSKSLSRIARIAGLCAVLVISIRMYGGDAPPLPEQSQARAYRPVVPIPTVVLPKLVPDPAGPLTLERLEAAALSGFPDQAFRREILRQITLATDVALPSNALATVSTTLGGKTTTTNSYVGGTSKATDDTLQDTEPSVVALNIGGADYTISAAIKYTNTQGTITGHINVSSTTTLASGSYTRQQLPMPLDGQGNLIYQNSGDPFLVANVYTGGVWGKRVYCVGVLFTSPDIFHTASAIGVWRSDDGGISWQGPAIVASTGGGGYFNDKPALAVSYYNGTLGHLYVT